MSNIYQTFVEEMGLPLAAIAYERYQQVGRGMLVVSDVQKGNGRFAANYVTLEEAEEMGYCDETLDAIRDYDPLQEAILYVLCGDSIHLKKVTMIPPASAGDNKNELLN